MGRIPMMKKMLCFLLALVLALSCCAVSLAADVSADLDKVTGAVEFPWLGFRFTPPELYRHTEQGVVMMEGAFDYSETVDFVSCSYYAMSAEKFEAYINSKHELPFPLSELWIDDLFNIFIVRKGMTFSEFNTYSGKIFTDEEVEKTREIGKVGDTTYYLMMLGPNPDFLMDVDPAFIEEYTALSEAVDDVISGFSFYEAQPTADPNADLIGSKLEFTTTDLDGNPVSSADLFAQNEITLLNIWATWCGPCVGEFEDLQGIYKRMAEKGVGVVGLMIDDDVELAREELEEFGVKYPVILAPENLDDLVFVNAYPTSVFVGKDGTVVAGPVVGALVSKYHTILNEFFRNNK